MPRCFFLIPDTRYSFEFLRFGLSHDAYDIVGFRFDRSWKSPVVYINFLLYESSLDFFKSKDQECFSLQINIESSQFNDGGVT